MKNEDLEKLQRMVHQPWVYRGEVVEILSYADYVGEDGDEVEIYLNNGKTIECRIPELGRKLKEFASASGTVVTLANHKLNQVSAVNPNVMQELRDTILDSIRAVKADSANVNQAKQVFQGVNTMINLAKMELEYRKFMDGAVAGNVRGG